MLNSFALKKISPLLILVISLENFVFTLKISDFQNQAIKNMVLCTESLGAFMERKCGTVPVPGPLT